MHEVKREKKVGVEDEGSWKLSELDLYLRQIADQFRFSVVCLFREGHIANNLWKREIVGRNRHDKTASAGCEIQKNSSSSTKTHKK